jgi:hypothetical protein
MKALGGSELSDDSIHRLFMCHVSCCISVASILYYVPRGCCWNVDRRLEPNLCRIEMCDDDVMMFWFFDGWIRRDDDAKSARPSHRLYTAFRTSLFFSQTHLQ